MKQAFFVFFVLSCAFLLSTNAQTEDKAEEIDNEFVLYPLGFQVAIKRKGVFQCSGLIVNEKTIVTTAKCVQKTTPDHLSVIAGVYNHVRNGQTRSISQIISHPQFKTNTMKNDIALLILDEPLEFSYTVKKGSFQVKEAATEQSVKLAGWGITETGSMPTDLFEVYVPTISNERCQEMWATKNVTIYPTQICTFFDPNIMPKGACNGDEGGPVQAASSKIIGLISYFPSPCVSGLPDVHTRIQPYLKWIKENSAVVQEGKA